MKLRLALSLESSPLVGSQFLPMSARVGFVVVVVVFVVVVVVVVVVVGLVVVVVGLVVVVVGLVVVPGDELFSPSLKGIQPFGITTPGPSFGHIGVPKLSQICLFAFSSHLQVIVPTS